MAIGHEQRRDQSELTLGEFVRARREEILREWERRVRELRVADSLDRPALLDHVPELLARIAEMADVLVQGGTIKPPRTSPRSTRCSGSTKALT